MAGSRRSSIAIDIPSMDPDMIARSCEDFMKYDENRDGMLNKKEFRTFLKTWTTPVSKYLFEIVDTDHSGAISLQEFLVWGQSVWDLDQKGDTKGWLKLIFDSCDKGNKGHLTKKEFFKFLKYNGSSPGFFRQNALFKRFDADGSGTVEFEEVLELFAPDS
jgi:Ca2+-binding EF-hand superfamily protein